MVLFMTHVWRNILEYMLEPKRLYRLKMNLKYKDQILKIYQYNHFDTIDRVTEHTEKSIQKLKGICEHNFFVNRKHSSLSLLYNIALYDMNLRIRTCILINDLYSKKCSITKRDNQLNIYVPGQSPLQKDFHSKIPFYFIEDVFTKRVNIFGENEYHISDIRTLIDTGKTLHELHSKNKEKLETHMSFIF